MSEQEKRTAFRALILITHPKLANKASDMFRRGAIPVHYCWTAVGTAPSEMIDILGLGSPDKRVLITLLPKFFADELLVKMKRELKLGTFNSGIAFTVPLTGANSFLVRLTENLQNEQPSQPTRKEEQGMAEPTHALIGVVVNQGYSEQVMDVAREVGAGGGTVIHGRHIGNKEAMGFWGMSIQEEKEMIFIVTDSENKLKIMQAIGDKCGMRSDAKGLVVSLPIDTVIGLE